MATFENVPGRAVSCAAWLSLKPPASGVMRLAAIVSEVSPVSAIQSQVQVTQDRKGPLLDTASGLRDRRQPYHTNPSKLIEPCGPSG